jgi:hypothetical protein
MFNSINSTIRTSSKYNVRDNKGLTESVLRTAVPALFAQEPHESRSSRYTYIPTIAIMAGMMKEGFVPVQAMQALPKQADKLEYAKHLVRFRRIDELNKSVGENLSEIVLVNSNDGSSAYQLMNGVFRIVCTNGLISGDIENNFKVRHTGNVIGEVIEAAYKVTYNNTETMERVSEMKSMLLAPKEREVFARFALQERFGEEAPFEADKLLNVRRGEDRTPDLYTTFNVIQENVIKGGLRGRNASNGRTTTRTINGIDQNVKLNKSLWAFADEIRKIHREGVA